MSDIVIPDYLKDLVDDTASTMITNTGSVPRISIRGRMFRFILEGNEEEKSTEPIHIIILGVVPEKGMAKTYYIDGYTPGSNDPPDCSSFLGVSPDEWADQPQARFCSECPQNRWGSAKSMSGGKAKACKDSKRLMVIKANDIKNEKPIIYIFNVTIASLKALSEYGKFLLTNKIPMAAAITKVEFVDSEFPQVEFHFVSILNETYGKKTLQLAEQKEWMQGLDTKALTMAEQAPTRQIENKPSQPQEPPTPSDTDAPPYMDTDDILNNWS